MKVLITNSVVFNGGVAASVGMLAQLMRDALGQDTECVVYEQNPSVAKLYYPDLDFRQLLYYSVAHAPKLRVVENLIASINRARFMQAVRLWSQGSESLARRLLTVQEQRDLENYATADLIVSTGGTYLVDNYDLKPRIFDYEVSLLLNKPLVFFTQSIGPIEKPENKRRLQPILDRARLILLRDEKSMAYVRRMGVRNPNIHYSADSVFAMNIERPAVRSADPSRRPRAAISVRHWPYFKSVDNKTGMAQYRQSTCAAVRMLVQRGYDVTFVSSCQGIREYWFDDAAAAREMVALLEPEVRKHVEVDAAFRTPSEMIRTLQTFDLAMATRFHMVVFSMLAGVPVLGVAYEFKTHELYRQMGLPDWVLDIEGLDSAEMCAMVERCLNRGPDVMPRLAQAVQRERMRVLEAGQMLAQIVNDEEDSIPDLDAEAEPQLV